MYMYSVIVYIIRMIVCWRMAVLCRVWSQCSASLVSLSDLQPLHPETRPSLHVHRQMHRLLQPSLLHLSHLLHLAGSHVCLHLLYGVCLDYTRRIFILQSHVFLFSIWSSSCLGCWIFTQPLYVYLPWSPLFSGWSLHFSWYGIPSTSSTISPPMKEGTIYTHIT